VKPRCGDSEALSPILLAGQETGIQRSVIIGLIWLYR
jgi:hypothetical protein